LDNARRECGVARVGERGRVEAVSVVAAQQ
jgi:hypothetical protein